MGTNNFHNKNASHVYAIEGFEDQWQWESEKEFIQEQLNAIEYNTMGEQVDHNGLRSYPSTILGEKTVYRIIANVECVVNIKSIIRSGYYDGANLDWEIEKEVFGLDPDHYDVYDILHMDTHLNKGMAKIQTPYIKNFLEMTEENLILELESLYKKITHPLNKVGQFSNGNAVYERA